MDIDKKTQYGTVNISLDAISQVACEAATECYGVVGISSKHSLKEEINEILKKENYSKGVYVRKNSKGQIEVDIYIVVCFGIRITETITTVQKKVKYDLTKTFNLKSVVVNVYVQGVKDI